jgi:hypothetical protein
LDLAHLGADNLRPHPIAPESVPFRFGRAIRITKQHRLGHTIKRNEADVLSHR